MNEHGHEHVGSVKTYLFVFIALLVCTFLTTEVAEIDLGEWNIVVAMTIAVFKMSLVALFFMHLKDSTGLTKLIAAAGLFWMAILFALTMTDYISRHWLPVNHFL